jgi:hypothetical protein
LANKLDKFTLMKRLRELEKIAKRLCPEDVPVGRATIPIYEWDAEAIRGRFAELSQNMDAFTIIAKEFGVEPFRIGQICKDLKEEAKRQRDKAATPESSRPIESEEEFI